MAWDKGFNFRATSGYVTDGANETYVVGDAYPVTRNSVTFGWLDTVGGTRDRSNTGDVRLAGINYQVNSGTQIRFQVDLPSAGTYTITLAAGDATNGQAYIWVQFLDSSTVLATIDDTNGTEAGWFDDATGVTRTSQADWISNEMTITKTFATATLIVKIGAPSAQADATPLAHLFVSQVAGGAAAGPSGQFHERLIGRGLALGIWR